MNHIPEITIFLCFSFFAVFLFILDSIPRIKLAFFAINRANIEANIALLRVLNEANKGAQK